MEADHRLSPQDHARISRDIQARELADSAPQDRPRVIILAGQPGAGKSRLTSEALRETRAQGGAVFIDIDDLRADHPEYGALSRADDRTAATLVQHDASAWGDELRQAAMAQRRNIVIDGTLKSEKSAAELCATFRQAGYDVEVRAMATRPDESRISVYRRYESQKARGGTGRWVPIDLHDAAVPGMAQSIDRLEREGLCDRVRVFGRGQAAKMPCLYDSGTSPRGAESALAAIEAERNRSRTAAEERAHVAVQQEVKGHILARDPHLTERENRDLFRSLEPDREPKPGSMAAKFNAAARPPTPPFTR